MLTCSPLHNRSYRAQRPTEHNAPKLVYYPSLSKVGFWTPLTTAVDVCLEGDCRRSALLPLNGQAVLAGRTECRLSVQSDTAPAIPRVNL